MLVLLLTFLFPLAVYFSTLALINRRERPLMVAGHWDMVNLLFASSGFLLIVGPTLLASLLQRLVRGGQAKAPPLFFGPGDLANPGWFGGFVWIAYYVLTLSMAVFLIWWHRRKTIIYHVDAAQLERVLEPILQQRLPGWRRVGNRIYLPAQPRLPVAIPAVVSEQVMGRPENVTERPLPTFKADPLEMPPDKHALVCRLDSFAALCHVTLHWRPRFGDLREEIEKDLRPALQTLPAPDNAASGWFTGVALGLYLVMLLAVAFAVINTLLANR